MARVNRVVESREPELEQVPKVRVTAQDIHEVKRLHILKNLLYTPEEAGQVLGKSARTILELVRDGKLVAAGSKGTSGLRITAESLESYRASILIPPEDWGE